MKKILIYTIILFTLSPVFLFANSGARNIIVHLNDSSRVISEEFDLPLKYSEKKDIHNPYIRVTDLNISVISYTSKKDNIKRQLSIEDAYQKLREIDFQTRVPGKGDKYFVTFKFVNGDDVTSNDTVFHKFKGFDHPSKKISIVKYDEYNNTWYPDYIKISSISKIEFRKPEKVKKTSKEGKLKKDKKEYKKRLLFSSDSFNMKDFEKNLKQSLLSLKNNKFNSSIVLRVNFDFNSSRLNKKAKNFLNIIGNVMSSPELYNARLSLRGFTDNVGKEKYNIGLSKRRANSVKSYLVKNKNIYSSRIKTSGYGESMPIAPNTSDYYKSLNRRVEISPVFY